jgi:ABC-2 type transport system permease protein
MGWALFDLPQPSSHTLLFLLALIFVAVMISLGLLISLIARTQQQAMFMAIFIMIPSILLSGFIFPLEAIPDIVRPISYIIPFTYFVDIIRALLIKHTQFADLYSDYVALSGFVLLFVSVSIMKFRKTL